MDETSIHKSNFQISLKKGEVAKTRIAKLENKPSFLLVGNGRTNHKLKGIDVMDLITEMANMTPQELYVTNIVRHNLLKDFYIEDKKYIEYFTNIAKIEGKNLTGAEKQKFQRGYKLLHEKKILRRVKRQYYIFNPSFIIPTFYEKTVDQFNEAK